MHTCTCVYIIHPLSCNDGYLGNSVHVRQLRVEVSAARELLGHQLHHVQQQRSSVHCVLHVRHTGKVLQVECLQLRGRGREGG